MNRQPDATEDGGVELVAPGPGEAEPLGDDRSLIAWFAEGEKPSERYTVGTEYEKLAVHRDTGTPLGYGGVPGIARMLEDLTGCCGWSPNHEGEHVIALHGADGSSVTLEPGGQFEMSGAPLKTVHGTVAELAEHEVQLERLESEHPVRWLWVGAHPVAGLDDVTWMPKGRYGIMRRYLPSRGSLAHHMMKTTCTVQANLDYSDETDMGRKLRASMGLGSVVTAMFANSPLREGRPSGFKSFRAHVWSDVDPDRTGLLPFVFEGEPPTYEEYVRYALDVPMFFYTRGGQYVDCAGLPFSTFRAKGHDGQHATAADWELHLSTLFPDTRLKQYLEMRTADVVGPRLLPALPALWKGLLYDASAVDAAWDLVKGWSFEGRLVHRADVAKDALAARTPRGHATQDVAKELLELARWSLDRQAEASGHPSEALYLEPLERRVREGRTPADETLAWYDGATRTDVDILAHYDRHVDRLPEPPA